LADEETLYPLEFFVAASPISSQGSAASKQRWKTSIEAAARARIRETIELLLLDGRTISVTIYYFPEEPMQGDIDNIVKPILDALNRVAYMDDNDIERILVQKFEPGAAWTFANPSGQLAATLEVGRPAVYIRIDDDLSWRLL
jgi:crossover junction endodeoxyribonuclease RusA